MELKNYLVVVIPVYKKELSNNELISLQQLVKTLKKYPICFLAPQGLKLDIELGCQPKYEYFPDSFFKSVHTYSRLMLTSELYQRFAKFEYMLVYQLDAFILKSNIQDFTELGYDYIGAPTLEGMYKPYREEKVLFTQNGGFSLRKISSFISWTKNNSQEIELMQKYDDEDSIIYALRHKGIKLAPVDVALRFSFDSNVRKCYQQADCQLPLGCHAWERYDYEFWKPVIEGFGYKTEMVDEGRRIVKDYYHIMTYNQKWIRLYDKDIVYKVLNDLLDSFHDRIYVWGMGKHGYEAMQLLLGAGIDIAAFLDTNEEKVKEGMYPCKAMMLDDMLEDYDNTPIIIAMYNHVDACVKLENKGLHHHKNYITYMELFQKFEIETMSQSQ